MKHRCPIVLLGLMGVAALATLITWMLQPHEPVYQGKPLSIWVSHLDRDARILGSRAEYEQAVVAVRKIGFQAIPFLLKHVRREYSASPNLVRAVWFRLPARLQRRFRGPRPPDDLIQKTAIAFSLYGTAGVDHWKAAFTDRSSAVRAVAARAVTELGQEAEAATPAAVNLLADPDATVQSLALQALLTAGANGKVAVTDLIRFLRAQSDSPDAAALGQMSMAMYVLRSIGPSAKAAIPDIATQLMKIKLPSSGADIFRLSALQALDRIYPKGTQVGTEARALLPVVSAMLNDPDPDIRSRAAMVLSRIQPPGTGTREVF